MEDFNMKEMPYNFGKVAHLVEQLVALQCAFDFASHEISKAIIGETMITIKKAIEYEVTSKMILSVGGDDFDL